MDSQGHAATWAGIDWSDSSHTICVVNSMGKELASFEVSHSAEGLDLMCARLREFPTLQGIAIETTRHLVVHRLLSAGFVVYAVNPKLSAAWRAGWTVAGAKDDPLDAYVLATGLVTHHTHLQVLQPDGPATRRLALLCEDETTLIADRTALVNRLKATLKLYFPAALDWFTDWTSPTSWDFILAFPTPQRLAAASVKRLGGFLAVHHIGLGPKWRQRLETRRSATDVTADEATTEAMALRVTTTAKQLKTLQAALEVYRTKIRDLFAQHPDAGVFSSLPGAGEKLAPRLLSLLGDQRQRFDSVQPIQKLGGTVPVTLRSGKKKIVCFRWACDKFARNTLHLFAFTSMRQSAWARAFYELRRNHGDGFALALRKLANKWLQILFRMWQENTPYDEQRYFKALERHRSPLWTYMTSTNSLPNGG